MDAFVPSKWPALAAHHVGVERYGISGPANAVAAEMRVDLAGVRERVKAIMDADGKE